ncbi:phosphate propanoyltransferase [Anaerotruncus rubiinfantis]|jgi:putative phosphotransacetylase|uniref:phosphate propanoyltransferase n=1 Tax=Anaerotruncus rubiinfantis TaxID=1720200 RepID=UPI000B0D5FD4|nr:phosphate propanoyltransferase [Anaerotruncus rubiinfantis]
MNLEEIQSIVEEVVSRCRGKDGRNEAHTGILVEASARHVHLTQQAVETLFGPGINLSPKRMLSQPGEFLAEQRVRLVTSKGTIDSVAVLGPARGAVQCELSMTDCRALGLSAPVNLSGDLTGAGNVVIVGPSGVLEAKSSVIVARAHIHLTPAAAAEQGVSDGQHVRVRVESARPVCFADVVIRVKDSFEPAMHLDFDEANACLCGKDTKAYILR